MSGAHLLQSYAHLDSPVHRASASLKLLATLAVVTGVAFLPVEGGAWALALVPAMLLVARVARVPLSSFVARVALMQPFVLGVALLALFQGRGLAVFTAIAAKSTACVVAVQLLADTTPFEDVLRVMRRARVPRALTDTLSLLHRYLFALVDESRRMRYARAARTWRKERWTSWRTLSSNVAVSFLRSVARAERVSTAMRARGGS